MKVKENYATFDTVEVGTVVKFAEEYYIKITEEIIEDGLNYINAVNLCTGIATRLESFYQVTCFPNATLSL